MNPHNPALPKPLPNGNFDAIAFSRASLARRLILDPRPPDSIVGLSDLTTDIFHARRV
jgi:hypothetical protein